MYSRANHFRNYIHLRPLYIIHVLTFPRYRYDLNPITVKYHETRPPIYHFLTTVCAIVGGTFTVAGIIDSCIFSATEIFKKFEIGKLS